MTSSVPSTGPELSPQAIYPSLALLEQRGLDVNALLAQAGWSRERVKSGTPALRWTEFIVYMDALAEALGSDEALETLSFETASRFRPYQQIAGLVVSPSHLFRVAATSFTPRLFPLVEVSLTELGPDELQFDIRIPAHLAGSLPMMRGFLGTARATPLHLGLPPARVSGTLSPHFSRLLVQLPASRTLVAKLSRFHSEVFDELAEELTEVVPESQVFSPSNSSGPPSSRRPSYLRNTSWNLLTSNSPEAFCVAVRRVLEAELGYAGLKLVSDLGPGLTYLGDPSTSPSDTVLVRDLAVEERRVGRLEVQTTKDNSDPGQSVLDSLLPWIALGLERAIGGRPAPGLEFDQRIERAKKTWNLTPRQVDILSCLVKGATNKEIAAELGCAEGTVELHVTEVLRRAVSSSRNALTARFWSEL